MLSSAVGADLGVRFSSDKEDWDTPSDSYESPKGTTIQVGVGISAFIY